jgi:hypothetical protein
VTASAVRLGLEPGNQPRSRRARRRIRPIDRVAPGLRSDHATILALREQRAVRQHKLDVLAPGARRIAARERQGWLGAATGISSTLPTPMRSSPARSPHRAVRRCRWWPFGRAPFGAPHRALPCRDEATPTETRRETLSARRSRARRAAARPGQGGFLPRGRAEGLRPWRGGH